MEKIKSPAQHEQLSSPDLIENAIIFEKLGQEGYRIWRQQQQTIERLCASNKTLRTINMALSNREISLQKESTPPLAMSEDQLTLPIDTPDNHNQTSLNLELLSQI
ncbi:MAG TPA: hypothetical protein VFN51_01225 [Candidatus Saccharimonadales bacterium]|nr:hypothetical protein [Candidatus Saccharimonadales bacterium]